VSATTGRGATLALRFLLAVAVLEFLAAFWVIVAGGFRLQVGPLRISASDALQPFRIATIAAAIAIWLGDRTRIVKSWDTVPRWARGAAAIAAALTVAAGVRWAVGVAGGSDAYGYVSQASLWLTGNLVVPEPLAALDPLFVRSASPLGYVPAQVPGASVPIYPSGLPLLMAAVLAIGRADGVVYLVVPIMGGVAVWCTYVVGERLSGARTGLLAAALAATSPMFLFHLFEPMGDLPVTAWWMASIALALGSSSGAAFGSGLAAAAAIVTRPNLVPLAGVVALLAALGRPHVRRFALFSIGALPGCLAVAAINQWLNGSALSSGYGPLSLLFNWSWIGPNLARYPRWLIELHTAGILVALGAPFVIAPRRATDGSTEDLGVRDASSAWILLLFCGVVLGSYLFYIVFPDWPALRFLLPAIPLLFVLASVVVVRGLMLIPLRMRGAIAFAFCGLLGSWYVQKADRLGVFLIQGSQQRYVTVGEFAARTFPEETVVLTVIQSGTLRMYGQQATLRWDQMAPEELDPILGALRAKGLKPYILVEDSEEAAFRAQFSSASPLGALDWPPAYEHASQPRVRIWDPTDRDRHLAGENVETVVIPMSVS